MASLERAQTTHPSRRDLDGLDASASEVSARRASFLSEAGTTFLSSALDLHEICQRAAELLVRRICEGCVLEVAGERPVVEHRDPIKAERLAALCSADGGDRTLQLGACSEAAELLLEETDLDTWSTRTGSPHAAALHALDVRSLMTVPLRARGESMGTITLCMSEPLGAHGIADRVTMERFAQKAALAIESARLYRAERRTRAHIERAVERARRIQAIASDLASALSSEQVGRAIVDHGVTAVEAATGGLWVLDPGGDVARAIRLLGFPEIAAERFGVLPMSAPVPVVDAIRRAEPVILESRAEYNVRYPESEQRFRDITGYDQFSLAVLPLVIGQAAIGALTFTWPSARHIEEDERAFLRLIAGHGAQGLVRAQLYDAERKARSEIAFLYKLVDEASQAVTLDEVYDLALEVVGSALSAERVAVLLFDSDGVMRFKGWRGISDAYRAAVEGHSPWSVGTRDAQIVVVADVLQDASLAQHREVFEAERIRALAFVPLVHRKQLLGKLMIYSETPRVLDADELRVAHSIATEVAHAIARKQGEAEVVRLFAEAQAARAAAEDASRMKDEFLGVVSHELRTPLSAILGWAGILKNGADVTGGTRNKGIAVIERNARAQLKIIEDILDVSRIISGKLVIEPKPTPLTQLVAEAIDVVRPSASAKDISISFSPSEERHTVMCDPERMRQVVWNLLSNAIKFTPRDGAVHVSLTRTASTVSLQVRDTGPGIAPEFLPHVFERFRQADSSTRRQQSGLGLGLAIVRHLVELHGGQVRADSSGLGQGATFTVTLPTRREAAEAQVRSTPDPTARNAPVQVDPTVLGLRDKRILVVDDNADAREMLEHALQMYGAQVYTAAGVAEAMDCIREHHPHVLISDIGMPKDDGYSLIRRVRALPAPDGELRAIAFTAYARTTDRARALEAGFDEHVAKPLHLAAFAQLIVEVSQRTRSPSLPPH